MKEEKRVGKRQVADWLQHQSGKFSIRAQKIIWITVALVVGTYCGSLLVGPVLDRLDSGGMTLSPKIDREDGREIEARIREMEFLLDSVGTDTQARLRDSLLERDPSLRDSIGKWREMLRRLSE